jgi:hypothetical protein
MLACTVATVSHLPDARVLASSFLDRHPGSRVVALVVDDLAEAVGDDEPFEVVRPGDVGIAPSELTKLALMYTPGALACALKPRVIRSLAVTEPVAFLDADCIVYADLEPLLQVAVEHGTALTAHSLTPHPANGPVPPETLFLRHGTFNSGVLASSADGLDFLDWWGERTARHTVRSDPDGLSLDQAWVSLVPALFDYGLVRDPGINVMGWNIHDRDVSWRGDVPSVPGGRLRCFHFAGSFDPHAPHRFGPAPDRHEPWPALADRPGVARVCDEYATRLLAAGYDEYRDRASPFVRMADGTRIDDLMREAYRTALARAERDGSHDPPNPFATATSDDFKRWLIEPTDDGIGPYLAQLRARRYDLLDAFPEVPGRDAARLRAWAAEAAARGEIDLSWVP